MPPIDYVWLIQQGGGYVAAAILFYFYQKENTSKQRGLREAHTRRDAREDKLLALIDKYASGFERIVSTMDSINTALKEHNSNAVRWYEQISRDLARNRHEQS